MIAVNFTAGTASNPMAITAGTVTNSDIVVSNNGIQIKVPGFYEITGAVTLTSSAAGSYGVTIYANGSASGNAFTNLAAAASESSTIPVIGVANVTATQTSGYATITFVPTGSPTVVSGLVTVKRIP